MTILRMAGCYFILAGIFLTLPPWFGANPALAALSVVGGLFTIGLGIYLVLVERKANLHR